MKTKINYLIWLALALIILPAISFSDSRPNQMVWNKDGTEMAYIPAGSFEMGDAMNETEDWMERSRPVHIVRLDGFYIDKTEVTVGQFKAFLADSGYNWTGSWDDVDQYSPGDDYPMIYVDWNDATAYAKWSGKRLPTEAEWEYAARGGLVRKRYPWGNTEPGGSQRNFADKDADAVLRQIDGKFDWADMEVGDSHIITAPVGSYPPNSFGLFDMAGNVYEWCANWYKEGYARKSSLKNPQGPDTGSDRVLRGGAWCHPSESLRVACRFHSSPASTTSKNHRYGFRCVSKLE